MDKNDEKNCVSCTIMKKRVGSLICKKSTDAHSPDRRKCKKSAKISHGYGLINKFLNIFSLYRLIFRHNYDILYTKIYIWACIARFYKGELRWEKVFIPTTKNA